MKFAVLIYESVDAFKARTGKDQGAYWGAWKAYSDALKNAGHHVGGSCLEAATTGTTVRFRDGERLVQDGPYADTKEQLGGFCIIDVPDLDAALDWAARCPAAAAGVVEVRPVGGMCSQELSNGAAAGRPAVASRAV
jgi:hypothetical protein